MPPRTPFSRPGREECWERKGGRTGSPVLCHRLPPPPHSSHSPIHARTPQNVQGGLRGSRGSWSFCAHFAKQQKFIAQVIDHWCVSPHHRTNSLRLTLSFPFFLSKPSAVSEKREPRKGGSSGRSAAAKSLEPAELRCGSYLPMRVLSPRGC